MYDGVRLGMLKGNRFSIALRFISNDISDQQIKQNVVNAQKNGFINYFGMQRFGSYSIRTHEIGKAILHCEWKEVCRLILAQYVPYLPETKDKKELVCKLVFDPEAEGDPHMMVRGIERAMQMLDNRDRLERCILGSLRSSPNGYFNAF